MREIDYRKQVIYATMDGNNDSIVTLITTAGMFSGKVSDVKAFELDPSEDNSEKIKEIAKEKGEINKKAIVLTIVDQVQQRLKEDKWINTDDLIHLEEVTFISNSGQQMSLPEITVSSNQVIAFLGGQASIS